MNHQLPVSGAEHHDFDELPGPAGSDDEIEQRVVAELCLGHGVQGGVLDVRVSDF
ncbi:MAG: hypothetical protein ACYC1D_05800 [Acidimicrobiales bacterium]